MNEILICCSTFTSTERERYISFENIHLRFYDVLFNLTVNPRVATDKVQNYTRDCR